MRLAKKIDVPFNGTKEQEERLKSELAALKESGGEAVSYTHLDDGFLFMG